MTAAISLEKVRAEAPGLVDLYKRAGVSLTKSRLTGLRAAVYLVLDRSGSMRRHYRDGSVQHLAEQALGLAAHLDDDGVVPVIFFDTDAHPPVEVSLTDYTGRIGAEHDRLGHMGTTNYVAAMRAVLDHYRDSGATDPAFVIFQTDGSPNTRRDTTALLSQASKLPLFWSFVGFGDDEFRYLRRLDDLTGRAVDNASFFPAGEPRQVPDDVLYDRLLTEFPDWLREAREKGIVV